jgi:hypothetical protein
MALSPSQSNRQAESPLHGGGQSDKNTGKTATAERKFLFEVNRESIFNKQPAPALRDRPPTTEEAKMKKQKFPPGWDEKRVQELIAHYENQTEDEEFADIEAAREEENITLMAIPAELVPEVRALLARKQSA